MKKIINLVVIFSVFIIVSFIVSDFQFVLNSLKLFNSGIFTKERSFSIEEILFYGSCILLICTVLAKIFFKKKHRGIKNQKLQKQESNNKFQKINSLKNLSQADLDLLIKRILFFENPVGQIMMEASKFIADAKWKNKGKINEAELSEVIFSLQYALNFNPVIYDQIIIYSSIADCLILASDFTKAKELIDSKIIFFEDFVDSELVFPYCMLINTKVELLKNTNDSKSVLSLLNKQIDLYSKYEKEQDLLFEIAEVYESKINLLNKLGRFKESLSIAELLIKRFHHDKKLLPYKIQLRADIKGLMGDVDGYKADRKIAFDMIMNS